MEDREGTQADQAGMGAPRAERPRILLVTDRLPGSDSGYGLRVTNVVNGLAQTGDLHVVVLDSSRRGERYPEHLAGTVTIVRAEPVSRWLKLARIAARRPTAVRYANHRAVEDGLRKVTAGEVWDLIWYSRATTYLYGTDLPAAGRIVDLDDLNDRLLRTKVRDRRAQHGTVRSFPRALWDLLDASRWARLQRDIASAVDRVVVCSDADRRRVGTTNCTVVPNGYPEPSEVGVGDGGTVPAQLLFVGPLTYEPNLFAAEWLVREILPRVRERVPGAGLTIVGEHEGVPLRRLQVDGVELAGWAPDVTPHYRAAGVAVTPLHSGGGTRLKVMEALARRVPLVSTSFGCEGLDLVSGRDLLVADDPVAFADACIAALTDVALRDRLSASGRERYVRDMSSTACSATVARLARDVTAAAAARAPHPSVAQTAPTTP
jgi:glycosyltransferase involved in cell wall biosynthesis